jgi:hypothetical protein
MARPKQRPDLPKGFGLGGHPKRITEQVIDFAVDCMARCIHKHKMWQGIQERWGKMDPKMLEQITSRARQRLIGATKKSYEERLAESINTYEHIIRNPDSKIRDITLAREKMDRVLGLVERSAIYDHSSEASAGPAVDPPLDAPTPPPGAVPPIP